MIIKYYNGYVSVDELNELMGTNRYGTSALNVINVARRIGFEASGIKATLEQINENNIILPCIAHVIIDKKYKHFVVIYKINFKSKTVIIADPQSKIKKMSYREFNKIYNNVLLLLYPVKPIVKNNEVSIKRLLINILKKYKKEIKHLLIISLILMFFSIITSFYMKLIFDNIDLSKDLLTIIFILFLSLNFIKIFANYLRTKLLIFINEKVDVEINMDAYKKVINLPYHYYKNRTTGEMISKLSDLDKIRDMINKVIIILFVDLPLTIFSTTVLILISKKLFLVSLVFLLLYALIIILSKKIIKNKTETCYRNKADTVSLMQESINGFETVKALNIENRIIKKYENRYIKYLREIVSLDNILNMQSYFKEMVNITNELLILFLGVILVRNNEMTVGNLLAFNSIQVFFFTPIRNIIDLDINLIEAKTVLKKVYEMFEEKKINISKKDIRGSISINKLTYKYNDKEILKGINLKIKKGDKVMILGDSGSGKSTLLKILIGYLKVGRNMIKYDDIDINDINNIRDNVTYISQNEVLFTDTIYNNICINDNDKISEVGLDCCIDEIIKNDQLGYNMLIEENGFNISGGQKQRIVLARALMKKFNILLIDEGLNQIDINLERKILKNIFSKYKDKTIIIVSHRKENIDLFNHLIELSEGKIKRNIIKNA